MDKKMRMILKNIRDSFGFVKRDIERLNSACDKLREDSTRFQNEAVNTMEVLDRRQKLIEESTAKLMASHGTSLHSLLRVNRGVIALKARLDTIAKEQKRLSQKVSQMDASIKKKLTAMNKDIKKRELKKVKRAKTAKKVKKAVKRKR